MLLTCSVEQGVYNMYIEKSISPTGRSWHGIVTQEESTIGIVQLKRRVGP